MSSVKNTLLWLTGFPLPAILLIALFVHDPQFVKPQFR